MYCVGVTLCNRDHDLVATESAVEGKVSDRRQDTTVNFIVPSEEIIQIMCMGTVV